MSSRPRDEARKTRRGLSYAAESLRDNLDSGLAYGVSLLVVFVWVWFTGGFFGLTVFQTMAVVGVFFTFLFITWTSQSELSFAFVFSAVGVLAIVWGLLPSSVQRLFPIDAIAGVLGLSGVLQASPLDAIQLGVMSFLVVLVYWIVTIRAGGGPKGASTVAGAILGTGAGERKGKLTRLIEEYVTIARLVAGLVLISGVFVLSQAGELAGVLGNVMADAPFVTSNIVTGIVGWFALGGRVTFLGGIPFIGPPLQSTINAIGISPGGWALLIIVMIGAAAAVRYS